MEEYVSFDVCQQIPKVAFKYKVYLHKYPKKCWKYETSSNGGHVRGAYLDDMTDMCIDNDYEEFWCTFTWNELYELMNKVVDGDYRKSEFELIDNIDKFALELNEYLKEKFNRDYLYNYGFYS